MSSDKLFTAGTPGLFEPTGDEARQAVDSLRGYAYQVMASALAWMNLGRDEVLYLEVAEDYSVVAAGALTATQVKDTVGSGSITLNTQEVRDAITTFVRLCRDNPERGVQLHYLTTSNIGLERKVTERPAGIAGLKYWRKAAAGGEVTPLRVMLTDDVFPEEVRDFVESRSDERLRTDLLRRIHWDCGTPDLASLKAEVEGGLVVLCRDRFRIPAPEARRLADAVFFEVLRKSVADTASLRWLALVDLYSLIDGKTGILVPRATLEALKALQGGGGDTGGLPVAVDPWLARSDDLPRPLAVVERPELQEAVVTALAHHGAVTFIWGGTGVGKSSLARDTALRTAGGFVAVDLRDADGPETQRRLQAVLPKLGRFPYRTVLLEDLNALEDDRASRALGLILSAASRHDLRVIVTLYRRPAAVTLVPLGVPASASIECPSFDEKEVARLVEILGGDPETWTKLAFASGGFGHPQLTHAFLLGMAARGWPISEIAEVIISGLSSEDTVAAREAARRKLTQELPKAQRDLLYRLSLLTGRFDRRHAISVGETPPPVERCSEQFDRLVGPWVDVVGKDRYRVSPLANGLAREMLSADQQKSLHSSIAALTLRRRSLTPTDVDAIFTHALAGEEAGVLAALSRILLAANEDETTGLASQLIVLPLLRTDRLIVPDNPLVSLLLRLAQFKLDMAGERSKARELLNALLHEFEELNEDGELGAATRAMVFSTILSQMGIANYLDDWVGRLVDFASMKNVDLAVLRVNVEDAARGATMSNILFSLGGSRIDTVERLEHVFGQLDALGPEVRTELLKPLGDVPDDGHSVMINSPWVAASKGGTLDAEDAAARYERMARMAHDWDMDSVSAQAWTASAVMLDEFLKSPERALHRLDTAEAVISANLQLDRARAKILYRARDYGGALGILRRIAATVGGGSQVERAFALREAAVSAAMVNSYHEAKDWFDEASAFATQAKTDDMACMAIGLKADAAVAAYRAGDFRASVSLMSDAATGLEQIDSDQSLHAAYLHRVIRHAAMWLMSQVTTASELNPEMEPGACSNPEPPEKIRQLPLGPLDYVWYMLAEVADAKDLDESVSRQLLRKIKGGPILVYELNLSVRLLDSAAGRLDTRQFVERLPKALSALNSYSKDHERHMRFDALSPERLPLTVLTDAELADAGLEQTARASILAFVVTAAVQGHPDKIWELGRELHGRFQRPPGASVIAELEPDNSSTGTSDTIVGCCRTLLSSQSRRPMETWGLALRLFEWAVASPLKGAPLKALASWVRQQFTYIIDEQTFRLASPNRTVPVIREALTEGVDTAMIGNVLLVSSEAIGTRLDKAFVEMLERVRDQARNTASGEASGASRRWN